ncbi:MAG: energy transducer TonB [Bacteroidia bacterium]|nr:energy transducer TonB [Bacteroidia bacterium]
MEAKKTKKAAIENRRGSWLLMGVIVALSFMFVSFEWTRHDVRVATSLSANDPQFVEVLAPITYPEKKPEPPPPPEAKTAELLDIVTNDQQVESAVQASSEDLNRVVVLPSSPPLIEEEQVDEDVIHVAVEHMPEFSGGYAALLKYLNTHIRYPVASQERGAQGRVIVQFVVDKDGSISDLTVVRGVDPDLDKEAIRVVQSMPKWQPGIQNGKKVRVKYTLPVMFRLQ